MSRDKDDPEFKKMVQEGFDLSRDFMRSLHGKKLIEVEVIVMGVMEHYEAYLDDYGTQQEREDWVSWLAYQLRNWPDARLEAPTTNADGETIQ